MRIQKNQGMRRGISMRAIQVALIVSLSGLWLFANTEESHACSCVAPGPPSEELAESATVFVGKVTSVREFQNPKADTYSSTDPTTVEFEVDTVWKGPSHETTSLTTARMGASCGFTFVEGEEHIVYSRDGATVSLCSRTRPVAAAEEDFKDLGEGRKPAPGSTSPTPEPKGGPPGSMSCGLASHAGHGPADASVLFMVSGLIWLGLRGRSRQ